MAKSLILAAAVLLALAASASAQCIECSKCTPGNSFCLQNCKRQCEAAFDANKCRNAGVRAGFSEGKEACRLLMTFCSQTSSSRSSSRSYGGGWNLVNLAQCQDVFYGGCQAQGLDSGRVSGCWFLGSTLARTQPYKLCDARTVYEFFNGELNARCNKAANYYRP